MTGPSRTTAIITAAGLLAAGLLWANAGHGTSTRTPQGERTTTARLFAKVAGPDPGPFGTSLEGLSFDSHGRLYLVNTTARKREPKIMRLSLTTHKATGLYEDGHSKLNCVGFAPHDVMYLCDLEGRVVRFDPATHKLTTVLRRVAGTTLVPDDMTVDDDGDMYIADYRGTVSAPTGRIVLRQANGEASVVVGGLAHPNGITLTAAQDALWVTEDLPGKLDHVAQQPSSPANTTPVPTVHTADYLSLGGAAYADSLTVDGKGDLYLAVYGAGEVLEFAPSGTEIGRVRLPSLAPRVTHVAIEPGTRRAFVTASGEKGGYVFTFQALAAAPKGRPNGG